MDSTRSHNDLSSSNADEVDNNTDIGSQKTDTKKITPSEPSDSTASASKEDADEEQKCAINDLESSSSSLECPVCLQSCIYPVQLPCGHIFCFLCVKGVAHRSKRCALCRQQIPADFFCQPNLVEPDGLDNPKTFDDGYGWFYGGINSGWWQYDERTSQELEYHHKAGHASCELLIAGFVYIIDFSNLVQIRRNDRTKKRRIKRDLINQPGRKGIAGLKINSESTVSDSDRPGADGHESGPARQAIPIQRVVRQSDNQSLSPPTPYNTPQTPQTPSESPPTATVPDLSVQLERLRLETVPVSSRVRGGSSGSSQGYNTPEQQSLLLDNTARLHDVSASLEQYQADVEREYDEEDGLRQNSCDGAKFV